MSKKIAVAGATGNLGNRIVKALRAQDAEVVALARTGAAEEKLKPLRNAGAEVANIDTSNVQEVAKALRGVACVISALQGLHDVIVDAQKVLLEAAIEPGVPRFIPSDFSTDFRKQAVGENRNFDLRREFHTTLDRSNIAATSIFNGAFAEMLTYNIPLLDLKNRTIGYWDDPDWRIAFTAMDDVAAYTAAAALDPDTPRALQIASFQISPRDLQKFTVDVLKTPFELKSLGSRAELTSKNKHDRAEHPEGENELYPAWQQGQYLQSMFSTHHDALDNARYPALKWTKLEDVIRPQA